MNKPRHAHLWHRDPHDYYVEEDWCNDRLFAAATFDGPIVDPACGLGRIVAAAIGDFERLAE